MTRLGLALLSTVVLLLSLPLLIAATSTSQGPVGSNALKFNADGTFRIAFLTDLHFGWTDDLDERTCAFREVNVV